MKVKSYILSLLFILILSGCSSPQIKSENVSAVTVSASPFIDRLTSITDIDEPSDISPFITLINQSLQNNQKVETQVIGDITLELNLNSNKTRKFLLDFNNENQEILIKENDETYLLDTETASSFFNTDYFKSLLHIIYPIPELTIQNNNKPLFYGASGEMKYDSFRNKIHTEAVSLDKLQELTEINSTTGLTTLSFNTEPTTIIENIYRNDELIDSLEIKDKHLLMPLTEGLYTIELDCTWDKSQTKYFSGKITYTFDFYYNMPSKFSLSSSSLKPGGLIFITAENIKDPTSITVNTTLFKDNIVFYPHKDGFFGILPLAGSLVANDYPIQITSSEDNVTINEIFKVLDRDYPIQNLKVSSSTLSLRTRENIAKNNETLSTSRNIDSSSPVVLWSEPFIEPVVDGIITTEYYHIRYTNGSTNARRHVGIDIAAPYDTPVLATNSGTVVVAEEMVLSGNTLIIDHGCGLFSMYGHLNRMDYNPGDNITRGDTLGLMGSTGFSTGSHLHFEMYYNGIYIDPNFFYGRDPYRDSFNK